MAAMPEVKMPERRGLRSVLAAALLPPKLRAGTTSPPARVSREGAADDKGEAAKKTKAK